MTINTFKLEDYLAQYEFKAKYLLCCSDAESISMAKLLAMANAEDKKSWETLRLGYTESPGLPELRQTIAKELYSDLSPDNILCFSGAEEGIFCTLYSLLQKGDHVIILTPCYQSLKEIPKEKGASITEVELREENAWHIDLSAIEKAIQPTTKCIVINFPHNPTGQVIDQSELRSLCDLCDKYGIWLFSDEVYRLLGEPKNPWASPAASLYNRAFSLGVMSKSFGMPGLRIGWIACQDKTMLQKIGQMKHYTSICSSAPSEILALIALRHKDSILNRNNAIVKKNLGILDSFMDKHQHLFTWVRPEGGCVGFIKYEGKEGADAFCQNLIDSKSTLLLPPSIYDYSDTHFRVGFGRENMPEALAQLEEFLKEV